MMKFISYIIRPVVFLLFLTAIALVVYFRSVIFLPHINQYVDDAQSYIERELDIIIPVHVAELIDDKNDLYSTEETKELLVINEKSDDSLELDVASEIVDADVSNDENKNIDNSIVSEIVTIDSNPIVTNDLLVDLTAKVSLLNIKVDKLLNEKKAALSNVVVENAVSKNTSNIKNKSVSIEAKEKSLEKVDSIQTKLVSDVQKLLNSARQTYWKGDSKSAEKMYLDLAGIEDNNPDIYGELGNVYYTQGKWKQAGKAYYEAALRLIALNKTNQVGYLLRVIQGLDSDSAEKLKQKISS